MFTTSGFGLSSLGLILGDILLPGAVLAALAIGGVVFFFLRSRQNVSSAASIPAAPQQVQTARPPERLYSPRADKTPKPMVEERVDIRDLPISRISSIDLPRAIDPLCDSKDDGLLAAIDEVQDDSDADSEFRSIALRVLAGFKSQNSIEALSQIALYDLSTTLRAQAVGMLSDFDHESVFEAIVLACADPSREVRAAGARALVKVTFDRGQEWARFALAKDQFGARQVARAAVEAGLVERSFDRLVLKDEKAVYEAFALVYLLVKTGETDKVFEAIRDHRDTKIRLALLHILQAANVAEVIPQLSAFIAAEPMSSVVADKARETLLGITAMPVEA
jgi:HEAT repeat protein